MKKLIDLLKKLLGSSSSSTDSSKGFTLIELMIVIAIIGVLAAAVLAAIDPIDKIKSGNDSKIQSDVSALYEGVQRTVASGSTTIPASLAALQTAGEVKAIPVPPANYGAAYSYFVNGAGNDAVVCGQVQSKANRTKAGATGAQVGYFMITAGKACYRVGNCSAATVCP